MTFGRNLAEYYEKQEAKRKAETAERKARNMVGLMSRSVEVARGSYAGGVSGEVVEKPEKARPGKRAPTVEERRWMDAIVAHGCVACRIEGRGIVAPCVHHILRGGRRIGHLFTLPLCPGHHQDGTGIPGMVARHPYKARFEERYGSEESLLANLRAELEWK